MYLPICVRIHNHPMLSNLIRDLEALDSSESWKAERELEVEESDFGYCKCTYNYGTTSFETWRRCMDIFNMSPTRFLVLGSSNGWIVFYAALTYPECICTGIELLESQVECSKALASKYILENAYFRQTDAIEYVKSADFDIVWVSSLCWPDYVRVLVFQGLLERMVKSHSENQVVVSYHTEQISDVVFFEEIAYCFSMFGLLDDAKFSWDGSGGEKLYLWRIATVELNAEEVSSKSIRIKNEALERDRDHETFCNLFG